MHKEITAGAPPLPANARDWAIFLDLDGTLAPLARRPADVVLDGKVIDLLARLQACFMQAVAVVSGRGIEDLDRLLVPLKLPLAGQHGAERRDAGGHLHHADPGAAEALAEARAVLEPFAAYRPGLVLEDKGLSLSLHFRGAPEFGDEARQLLKTVEPSLGQRFIVEEGKQVLEVRSSTCNKGSAIRDFLGEVPFGARTPIFAGDDLTDEDGFRAVNDAGGISIKIGNGTTHARYRLPDPAGMLDWLGHTLSAVDR